MFKFKKVFIPVVLCFTLLLVGCGGTHTSEEVEGVIIERIFDEGYTYTTFSKMGSTFMTTVHTVPDKYFVRVKYKDVITQLESNLLYHSVKTGDSINVLLVKRYDKEGKPKDEHLELIE